MATFVGNFIGNETWQQIYDNSAGTEDILLRFLFSSLSYTSGGLLFSEDGGTTTHFTFPHSDSAQGQKATDEITYCLAAGQVLHCWLATGFQAHVFF